MFVVLILPNYSIGSFQVTITKPLICKLCKFIYPTLDLKDTSLKYYLFTQKNPQNACDLQPTKEGITKCNFNPAIETKVIVHGWVPNVLAESPVYDLKDKLLQVGNYNVVVFIWTKYSNTYNYSNNTGVNYGIAGFSSYHVGLQLSSWIYYIQKHAGSNPKSFHLIAHSLGSEVSSFASKTICNLGKITYLDAAAPVYRDFPYFLQPSSTDADFVESIHTNGALIFASGYGYLLPIADIDYYPNGGQVQPQCYHGAKFKTETGDTEVVESHSTARSCYHDSAFTFYIASLSKSCVFRGLICDNYKDYTSGKCSTTNAPACELGGHSKRPPDVPVHSKCYFKTPAKPPYCRH